MKNIPASYNCNKFMKKFFIYKITFEWYWKSLSLMQNLEISTCEIVKTWSLQNLMRTKTQDFFVQFQQRFWVDYENKTNVCFFDYLIFNKDYMISSGTSFIEKRLWYRSFSPRFSELFVLSALLEKDCFLKNDFFKKKSNKNVTFCFL